MPRIAVTGPTEGNNWTAPESGPRHASSLAAVASILAASPSTMKAWGRRYAFRALKTARGYSVAAVVGTLRDAERQREEALISTATRRRKEEDNGPSMQRFRAARAQRMEIAAARAEMENALRRGELMPLRIVEEALGRVGQLISEMLTRVLESESDPARRERLGAIIDRETARTNERLQGIVLLSPGRPRTMTDFPENEFTASLGTVPPKGATF